MFLENKILIGKSQGQDIYIYPSMANRHGLIAGATGTGKTISLKVLAESFSSAGVPVFMADVKGDLSGTIERGILGGKVLERYETMQLGEKGFESQSFPVNFWDVYAEKGLALRTTISEMGPMLLANILELNEVQAGILNIIFNIADDQGLLLIDIKDLKAMIQYVGDNAKDYTLEYGNITKQSLGAITRALVSLESQGGEVFFAEPALDIRDWINVDANGKGNIQILDCQKLIHYPKMYSTFLLWMISELFESLPEVGDVEKPKIIFFFDEAHMLFNNASKQLLEKIEQLVKMIRSKGVGIYFVTQSPSDIPDGVLAQLGNKIQHALRAYTPKEQKAAKACAESYRANPDFDTYEALLNLATGEAIVSVLDEKGIPTMAMRTMMLPPQSKMGPVDDLARDGYIKNSLIYSKYSLAFDRDSAFEFIQRKSLEDAKTLEEQEKQDIENKEKEKLEKRAGREKKSVIEKVASTALGSIGRELGNTLGKSVGGTFGKRIGGNVGASLGRGLLKTIFKL